MDYTSPFQQWLDANMKGIAASPDIMLLLAKAFEGGRLYEQEDCANVIAKCADTGDDRGIEGAVYWWNRAVTYCANAVKARKF